MKIKLMKLLRLQISHAYGTNVNNRGYFIQQQPCSRRNKKEAEGGEEGF